MNKRDKHDNAELVDLVVVAKDLLEICRIKCSPTDEVWRADGISNEQVMIASMAAIKRAEFALAKKPRAAKPSTYMTVDAILSAAVARATRRYGREQT
jgi:hypothetical protein